MYIKFKHIKIHNFFSIKDADVDLSDNGFVLVNGVNNNPLDTAKSNGAGKSTIFESLSWAMTGETLRGVKQVARLGSEDGCFVDLTMDVDGQEYRILRTQDYRGDYK